MTLRAIQPIELKGVVLDPIPTDLPLFAMADPRELVIDDTYQRELSPRSIRLIRKLVQHWDWVKFIPPLVVEVDGQLHVIDGQHESIAAVTRGDIAELPVMIASAGSPEARAAAFVGRNRDRLAVSAMQLHHAAVAAGNEDAMTIHQVCNRAGVNILRVPPGGIGKSRWKPGDTLAIGSIQSLVRRRFAVGGRKVLEAIVNAGMAPVTANQIKAVEALLFMPPYKGKVTADQITAQMRTLGGGELERRAAKMAATVGKRDWWGMAEVLFARIGGTGAGTQAA